MTQGRKSRTARALGCLLAAMLALAAVAPAMADAQAGAEDEYELGPIPGTGGKDQDLSAGGDLPAADESGATTEPAVGTDQGSTAGGGGSGGGNSGGNGGNGGSGQGAGGDSAQAPAPAAETSAVTTDSSDDGGAPVLLILLAVLAAICTGVAVWRIRRDPGPSGRDHVQGAQPTTGAASESHSA